MEAADLKHLRGVAGLSQAQLGKAIGMSGPSICEMETGKATISKAHAQALSAVLAQAIARGNEPTERKRDERGRLVGTSA
jgi:transcriptional regulator with XRE-family HTH domain